MAKVPVEQRTCPECGFIARNVNGLRGHRQFKHGIKPAVMNQVTLEQQSKRLVTEDMLEQLEERFVDMREWEDCLNDQVESFDRWRREVKMLQQQVSTLQRHLNEIRQQQTYSEISNVAFNSRQLLEGALKLLEQDVNLLWLTFDGHIHSVKTDSIMPHTNEFLCPSEEIKERILKAKEKMGTKEAHE